jgi:hypothetical protein
MSFTLKLLRAKAFASMAALGGETELIMGREDLGGMGWIWIEQTLNKYRVVLSATILSGLAIFF